MNTFMRNSHQVFLISSKKRWKLPVSIFPIWVTQNKRQPKKIIQKMRTSTCRKTNYYNISVIQMIMNSCCKNLFNKTFSLINCSLMDKVVSWNMFMQQMLLTKKTSISTGKFLNFDNILKISILIFKNLFILKKNSSFGKLYGRDG